ncbi:uncharacterized protein [Choristoneura fumiferana]|uniref:uncharacterized protein n=1 Tax=Choristoneura fumiferana TaxID=7141 RepID=UPI003D15A33D
MNPMSGYQNIVYPLIDDVECNLTVAVRLPLDYCTPFFYPVAYLITSVAFNYVAFFVMTNDVIMQAHLIHLLCQYAVLVDCFENILNDCKEDFKGYSSAEIGDALYCSGWERGLTTIPGVRRRLLPAASTTSLSALLPMYRDDWIAEWLENFRVMWG